MVSDLFQISALMRGVANDTEKEEMLNWFKECPVYNEALSDYDFIFNRIFDL